LKIHKNSKKLFKGDSRMKNLIAAALLVLVSSSAFAGSLPTCKDLVNNTAGIVTLQPITSASNPIQAGDNVIFAATVEGVDAGSCAARVTVHAGHLVIFGLEHAVSVGACIVVGAADLVETILHDIFGA
jgi:hypothetical protein